MIKVNATRWQDNAACIDDTSGADWYAERGTPPYHRALIACAGCVVRTDCLLHALRNDENYGIWGGMTAAQREAYKRERRGLVVNPRLSPLR